MPNVCHIISGDLWAGAEAMAYQLLKGLNGYPDLVLLVILLNEGKLGQELRKLDIRTYVMEESKMSFLSVLRSLRKTLAGYKPDLLHTHRYKENILAYLSSNFARRAKLVATQHGMPEVPYGLSHLMHSLVLKYNTRVLSHHFHEVVTVSNDIRKIFLKELGFERDKVGVIHNGIEIPGIVPEKGSRESFVVGSCGRLFPVKDYPFMVEIAKRCRDEKGKIRFELAGNGPELSRIQMLISRYGLEASFKLWGHLDDMSDFYQGLDLFLNTSVHEGIPMSVLEAMAHGLPVVAPRVGGFSEIINDGIEGFLIEGRDPSLFAEKCSSLWENRELWERMSSAAREKVRHCFSVETMAQKYHDLYLSVLENR